MHNKKRSEKRRQDHLSQQQLVLLLWSLGLVVRLSLCFGIADYCCFVMITATASLSIPAHYLCFRQDQHPKV